MLAGQELIIKGVGDLYKEMNRPCVNCRKIITVKTLQQKYCDVCGPIIQKEKSNDWLRNNRRRDFDLFCLECGGTIPNALGGRKYCDLCADIRAKTARSKCMKNQKIRVKLDKFYKNLRINLIQSPYFVDRKTLSSIILLENK